MRDFIKVTREELYEEIWTTPIFRLAAKYKISDVGLAKICKKMEIPRPGRGYWTKIQNGAKLNRPNLKKLSKQGRSQVVIYPTAISSNPAAKMEYELFESESENKIVVSTQPTVWHPLVDLTQKRFQHARKDSRGVLRAKAKRHLDIRVTKASLKRSLTIMDALAKALEQRNLPIHIGISDDGLEQHVTVNGEKVVFHLEEKIHRSKHEETEEEKRKREELDRKSRFHWDIGERMSFFSSIRDFDYFPTGELCLCIDNLGWSSGLQANWRDGKAKPIEQKLNNFVVGLYKAATYLKEERIRRAKEEKERQERAERYYEEQRRRAEEERNIQQLDEELARWQKSKDIRDYLTAIRAEQAHISIEAEQWLAWVENYANRIDPTKTKKDC